MFWPGMLNPSIAMKCMTQMPQAPIDSAARLSQRALERPSWARALVTQPKFMMLDEPFAGVDPIAVHDIQSIVADLRHRGIGVLISDHNVEQTLDIVDRAYILHEGKVLKEGLPTDIVKDENVRRVYLGDRFSM